MPVPQKCSSCALTIHNTSSLHPFFTLLTSPYAGGASTSCCSIRSTPGATLTLCISLSLSLSSSLPCPTPPTPPDPLGTSLKSFSSLISTSFLNALNASATSLPSVSEAIFTLITPVSSIATSVASTRVPSSGSEGEPGMSWRQPGFVADAGGVDGMGIPSYWRREKKSLISWPSRLREPLEVRREIRPSVIGKGQFDGWGCFDCGK